MNRRTFLMAAVLVATLAAPATAQITQPTENLKVAMDVGFAPFAYRDAKGTTVGFTVDFVQEIAKRFGRPGVDVIDQPYAGIFAGLFAKRYDFIIAPTNITEERAKQMLFSEPYMATGLGFLVKTKDTMTVLEDLKGKVVTVNSGSISDTWATENAPLLGFTIQRYSKNADAVQAVRASAGFAKIDDVPGSQYTAQQQAKHVQ